jgi:arginine decarboxylase
VLLAMASSVGTGPTELAAFDDALLRVGAGNYNLVRLSSVIPPAARIVDAGCRSLGVTGEWGDRLYTVYAARCASGAGEPWWQAVDLAAVSSAVAGEL